MIEECFKNDACDPELRRHYEWRFNHYELRERCRAAFWRRESRWEKTREGQAWLERARVVNACVALIHRWRLGRVFPHRVYFVRACQLMGWTLGDFFGPSAALSTIFPRHGRNNAIMAPEYREHFREVLCALWDAPPTPARAAASQMRSIYDWLLKLKIGERTNVTPVMLRAFCATIGRSAVAMVSPYMPKAQSKAAAPAKPAPTPHPVTKTQPEPGGWSFFGGCA